MFIQTFTCMCSHASHITWFISYLHMNMYVRWHMAMVEKVLDPFRNLSLAHSHNINIFAYMHIFIYTRVLYIYNNIYIVYIYIYTCYRPYVYIYTQSHLTSPNFLYKTGVEAPYKSGFAQDLHRNQRDATVCFVENNGFQGQANQFVVFS